MNDDCVRVSKYFTIKCKQCGGYNIELEDSRGWSCASGGWGSVDMVCVDCGTREEILDND